MSEWNVDFEVEKLVLAAEIDPGNEMLADNFRENARAALTDARAEGIQQAKVAVLACHLGGLGTGDALDAVAALAPKETP